MENQNQKQSEEIDLLELFQRMGNSIRKGVNWVITRLYNLLILIIRKSVWIIGFTCIGIAIGLLFFNHTSRFYTSSMVAKCNSTDNNIVISAINQLNDLCLNDNNNMLAKYLEITTKQASEIKSIEAFYGIDVNRDSIVDYIDYTNTYNPKDTSQKIIKNMVFTKVEVYNEEVFAELRDGLKKFIWRNPYIAKNNEVRKEQVALMICAVDREIKKLDSLQQSLYHNTPKANNGQILFWGEKEMKLFHNDMIKLVSAKQKLEKSLSIDPDPITVTQDFTPLSKAENPWTKYVKAWGITFAILGFITALLWQYRKKIYHLIKEKQY